MIDPKALGDEIDAGRGRQAFSPEERRLLMVALHAYASRPEAPHEEQVLYCPGCGSVGPVPKPYQHCCPDHGRARMVPKAFAEQCAATFRLAIQKPVVVNGIPSSEDPPSLR